MSDELVFYTNPMSRGRTVRWMLEEVGQPYRTELLDYATTMKAPDYLAINPMGKVPALRHGDTVVTETAAICAYLADAFPEAGLAPPPGHRAARPLLSLAVLRRGPARGGVDQPGDGFHRRAATRRGWPAMATSPAVVDALEGAVSRAHRIWWVMPSPPPMSMSAPNSVSACSSA